MYSVRNPVGWIGWRTSSIFPPSTGRWPVASRRTGYDAHWDGRELPASLIGRFFFLVSDGCGPGTLPRDVFHWVNFHGRVQERGCQLHIGSDSNNSISEITVIIQICRLLASRRLFTVRGTGDSGEWPLFDEFLP